MKWLLYDLNDLLNGPGTMSMATKTYWVGFYFLNDLCKLAFRAVLCDLLRKVVSKGIVHDFHEVIYGSLKYHGCDVRFVLLNLFLKETAAALVLS